MEPPCPSPPPPSAPAANCASPCSAPSPRSRSAPSPSRTASFAPSFRRRRRHPALGRPRLVRRRRRPGEVLGRLGQGQDGRGQRRRERFPEHAALPARQPVRPLLQAVRHARRPGRRAMRRRRAIPASHDHGAGLRLLHLGRRLHRHQQPRRRPRDRSDGDHLRRQDARRQGDRHRRQDRPRAAEGHGLGNLSVREVRAPHAARRRLGDRGRQPVRPRRHGDRRHRLGARPRHRLGPL